MYPLKFQKRFIIGGPPKWLFPGSSNAYNQQPVFNYIPSNLMKIDEEMLYSSFF